MVSQFGIICAIILLVGAAHASIENSPVKVTHRNLGPRYDLEDMERGERPSQPQDNQVNTVRGPSQAEAPQDARSEETPIGHLSIRRIFLVPMMGPVHPPDHWPSASDNEKSQEEHESSHEHPSMMTSASKPFWPFAPPTRHHILGGDEASRSPSPAVEREDATQERPSRPLIDPIQMMIDMMHQALNPGNMRHPSEIFGDLNREASSKSADNKPQEAQPGANDKPTELSSPSKPPTSNNETKEDIVEIEGKKYLRKTVINRHVGENIIFMTKRLIFTPLNETDSEQTITSTTSAPQVSPSTEASPVASEEPKKVEEPSSTTTTTTTSTTSAQPSSSEPVAPEPSSTLVPLSPENVETPSSTQSPNQEATTGKESWVERVSDAIAEKIAEAVEPSSSTTSTTTTAKPVEGQ